jgi:exo-beta-1,3-glucanase (GH17 family)
VSTAEQEEADLEALQERERAIRQLESDIVDVNTIFKVPDLSSSQLEVSLGNARYLYKCAVAVD